MAESPSNKSSGLDYSSAITLAKGCADYCGGYSGENLDAFQMGIQTVVNVLEKAQKGWDTQIDAVWQMGSVTQGPQPS